MRVHDLVSDATDVQDDAFASSLASQNSKLAIRTRFLELVSCLARAVAVQHDLTAGKQSVGQGVRGSVGEGGKLTRGFEVIERLRTPSGRPSLHE